MALKGRDADWAEMKPIVEMLKQDPLALVNVVESGVPEPKRLTQRDPLMRAMFADAFAEAVRQGGAGWLDDDMAGVRPWGFDLDRVRCPVRLWHGDEDRLVPLAHSEYLARKLPDGSIQVVPGAGHGLLEQYGDALEWLRSRARS